MKKEHLKDFKRIKNMHNELQRAFQAIFDGIKYNSLDNNILLKFNHCFFEIIEEEKNFINALCKTYWKDKTRRKN